MPKGLTRPDAAAVIRGGESAPHLRGEARFYQKRGGVLTAVQLSGLPESGSFFGLHIHEGRNCGGEDFSGTGGHYDPADRPHPLHAGDLPPLLNCGGNAYLVTLTDRFSLQDVVGRTVVIHSAPDDFRSQPAGNAGEKIGCGVIRKDPYR